MALETSNKIKLTEDDLSAQTDVRVHLDTWLKRWEWEQILEDQTKAEKWDKEGINENNKILLKRCQKYAQKLEQESKQLKEKLEKINKLSQEPHLEYEGCYIQKELQKIITLAYPPNWEKLTKYHGIGG